MDQIKEYYQRWCDMPQPRKIRAITLIAFACYFLFLFLLVVYAFGRTGARTSTIVPTVLFTDGTPYSTEIIRYLTQRRDVVLCMIVLSNNSLAAEKLLSSRGNIDLILDALQAEGYTGTVPVYTSETSSSDNFEVPLEEMLAKQPVNFVIVGPCTEAAFFLSEYPARRSNVVDIFVAGGAFNEAGNANYFFSMNTKAERNFYMDPAAADYIMAATHGRPVTLFPIDVTAAWTRDAYTAIVSNPSSAATSVTIVSTGLQWYYASVDSTRRTTVGLMAAAYASDAQVRQTAVYTSIPVHVRTAETNMTKGESYRPASGTPVRVVLSVAEDTFFSHLVSVDKLPLA